MRNISILLTVLTIVAVTSCSGGGGPVTPATPDLTDASPSAHSGQHCLLGYWDIFIDAERSSFEIIPLRDAQMHFNVLYPVEHTWEKSYLEICNVHFRDPNSISLSAFLNHPFPGNLPYTGFDVRVIFISQATCTFPATGATVAYGDDVPRLLNPDGYTSLFNPVDYPESANRSNLLKYNRGELAVGSQLTSTVNPYKACGILKYRRAFVPGNDEFLSFSIHLPDGPVQFGYAIDASWAPAPGPITDPYTQFPMDANCLEAFKIDLTPGREILPEPGSTALIGATVYDWQGAETIDKVEIEIPGLFAGTRELEYVGSLGGWAHGFLGQIENELGAGYGDYPMIIRVTDTQLDPNLGVVYGWDFDTIRIKHGWARTTPTEAVQGITADSSGILFATGMLTDSVDLDPGPGQDLHSGDSKAFLVSYTPRGDYLAGLSWGIDKAAWSYEMTRGVDVAVTDSSIYVIGLFTSTVDFDPGPGEAIERVNEYDIHTFLSKFDKSGNFQWVRAFGPCEAEDFGVDRDGNVYIVGTATMRADFNPDPDLTDYHFPPHGHGAFITHIKSDGSYGWTGVWGEAEGHGIAVRPNGYFIVTGGFAGTVDLDPGPEVSEHVASGEYDVYLSSFTDYGQLLWTGVWGSEWAEDDGDMGYAAAVDPDGDVYVTGFFTDQADFDPGPGVDMMYADAEQDVFLSKFDSSGQYLWARHWGGSWHSRDNIGNSLAVDHQGNIAVVGSAGSDCDFDPSPGTDIFPSEGMFVSQFNSAGDFQWARSWPEQDVYDVTIGPDNSLFLCGYFKHTDDADPTEGVDIWPGGGLILKLTSDGKY
jgi:hypothetical protein